MMNNVYKIEKKKNWATFSTSDDCNNEFSVAISLSRVFSTLRIKTIVCLKEECEACNNLTDKLEKEYNGKTNISICFSSMTKNKKTIVKLRVKSNSLN